MSEYFSTSCHLPCIYKLKHLIYGNGIKVMYSRVTGEGNAITYIFIQLRVVTV